MITSIQIDDTQRHEQKFKKPEPLDDSVLTLPEREWAFELEEALYGTDEEQRQSRLARRASAFRRRKQTSQAWNASKNSNSVSEFELATHAILNKGKTPRALKRLKRLQEFKTQYAVPEFGGSYDGDDDEFEAQLDATLLVLKKFLSAYPDFVKSIGMDKHGRVTVVCRIRGLRWSATPPFNHTEADRFRALYCLLHALQPTLESVRRGTVWIGDMGGVATRPRPEFLEGCRKLLRDSYPIRVQDIPCVRCPSVFSGAFAGTYPFWSRHFATKFIRVDSATLKRHFPPELLGKKRKEDFEKDQQETYVPLTHRRLAEKAKKEPGYRAARVEMVAGNGDLYDNDWENLNEDSGEFDDLNGGDDVTDSSFSEAAIGNGYTNDELWEKIERLVRMRFETERTFRLV